MIDDATTARIRRLFRHGGLHQIAQRRRVAAQLFGQLADEGPRLAFSHPLRSQQIHRRFPHLGLRQRRSSARSDRNGNKGIRNQVKGISPI